MSHNSQVLLLPLGILPRRRRQCSAQNRSQGTGLEGAPHHRRGKPRGATTTGPDATHPPSCLSKLGQGGGVGWRVWRGGGSQGGGGGPARDPLLPHADLQGGCVSGGLGVRRYVCDDSAFSPLPGYVLLIWRSKHGWFDEREACTKKIGRRWRHAPQPTTLKTRGGGGTGLGGGVAYKDRARPPPHPPWGGGKCTKGVGAWLHHSAMACQRDTQKHVGREDEHQTGMRKYGGTQGIGSGGVTGAHA